ncbi:hypothetical protein BASA81_010780 [Batrachochytrium salamandrivorans]|nr:hypothetical protein BASA81_010780 [Batrachochytrium salamandrivorans]
MKRMTIAFPNGEHEFAMQTFPELAKDEVGFHFYESSHLLAAYLAQSLKPTIDSPASRRVLELGSGSCGLVGLALCRLNYHVTFSDIAAIVPYLQLNVDRNLDADTRANRAQVIELNWGVGNFPSPAIEYQVIVAADCTYLRSSVIPLLETISLCLAKRGECYIAHEEREQGLDEYFELTAKALGFKIKRIRNRDFPHPFLGDSGQHLKLFKLVRA